MPVADTTSGRGWRGAGFLFLGDVGHKQEEGTGESCEVDGSGKAAERRRRSGVPRRATVSERPDTLARGPDVWPGRDSRVSARYLGGTYVRARRSGHRNVPRGYPSTRGNLDSAGWWCLVAGSGRARSPAARSGGVLVGGIEGDGGLAESASLVCGGAAAEGGDRTAGSFRNGLVLDAGEYGRAQEWVVDGD